MRRLEWSLDALHGEPAQQVAPTQATVLRWDLQGARFCYVGLDCIGGVVMCTAGLNDHTLYLIELGLGGTASPSAQYCW